MLRITFFFFSLCIAINSLAQLQIVPLPRSGKCCESKKTNARTKSDAMPLPFWDDFSYASETVQVPNDTLWQYAMTVWTNNGMSINPPSLGVATFDGVDSQGKPYSVNDVLAKGIADSLISRPIRMDLVEATDRASVYLSFYFQFKGNGEAPDAGDQLIVSIKNDKGKWDIIKVIENEGAFKSDVFNTVILPIAGDQYFHDKFQFRIHSFGRLSGPYDTWNLDYIYLNKGRSTDDTSYPDRTITSPPTSLFNSYYAIPLKHFLIDPLVNMIRPTVPVFNLKSKNDSSPNSPPDEQPFNYTTQAIFNTIKDKDTTTVRVDLDTKQEPGFNISPFRVSTLTVKTTPDPSLFSSDADEVRISFKLGLSTKDSQTPTFDGDYDSLKYQPIDFRQNDSTRAEYILSDYYAYDDGTAEYGASLVQPGSRLAYLFEQRTAELDTVVRIDLYFPKFGDETSQVMQLQILRDLTDGPGSLLYTENITIQRGQNNEVWQHVLARPVGVSQKFYIGLKQTSSAIIAIGLDKNTDSGQKMFFNSNGTWVQNTNVKGSLMIRPAFGKGEKGDITGVEDESNDVAYHAYPNPSSGVFYVPAAAERIHIFDMAGRQMNHEESIEGDRKRIQLFSAVRGIYVLKIFTQNEIYTQKIMVQQ